MENSLGYWESLLDSIKEALDINQCISHYGPGTEMTDVFLSTPVLGPSCHWHMSVLCGPRTEMSRVFSHSGPRTEMTHTFLFTLVLGLSCHWHISVLCGPRTEMTDVFLATLVLGPSCHWHISVLCIYSLFTLKIHLVRAARKGCPWNQGNPIELAASFLSTLYIHFYKSSHCYKHS